MEEPTTWDDVEDAELLRAIEELLQSGELTLPVCPRCLRPLGPPSSEIAAEGAGYEEPIW